MGSPKLRIDMQSLQERVFKGVGDDNKEAIRNKTGRITVQFRYTCKKARPPWRFINFNLHYGIFTFKLASKNFSSHILHEDH